MYNVCGCHHFHFMNPGYVFSAHLYSQRFSYHNLHNYYTNHYST